jgi:hypothetical protein
MNMKLQKLGMLGLVCGAMAASVAQASSVTLRLDSPASSAVNPGVDGGLKVTFTGGSQSTVYTGQMNWDVTASSTAGYSVGQGVSTYCIQGLQSVSAGGSYTYTLQSLNSPNTPNGGSDQGVLDSTAALQIQGFADTYYASAAHSYGSYNADETAAAFQLAIWEIEYDGGAGKESFTPGGSYNFFTHGLVEATGTDSEGIAAVTLANNWLNNFTAASSVSSLAFVNSSAQDQFIYQPGGNGGGNQTAVPLPAAFPAGIALLGGLFGARKMKRK